MTATEQRVRDAAAALHDAIADARSEGLYVTWPRNVDDLPSIAISETAKSVADFIPQILVQGEPLLLTDEERAALPQLDPNPSNDPKDFVTGQAGKNLT